MRLSVARHLGGPQRVYHFVLYGLTASGKTCFLTALGMERQSGVEGLQCVRLNCLNQVPRPAGDPEAWDVRGDPIRSFYQGDCRIHMAEAALCGGSVPSATPPQAPLLLVYSYTHPEHGQFYVELIDYSGELVNPDLIHDTQGLSRLLQGHLTEADGMIVLAEVPRQQCDQTAMPGDLDRLCAALDLLHQGRGEGPRWSCPAALVLTKWDRQGNVGRGEDAVEAFLGQSPAIRRLRDRLCAVMTAGNFRAFAASAFGQSLPASESSSGTPGMPERPAGNLSPYGLDEPILWAVERRDATDLAAYHAAVPASPLRRWLHPAHALAPIGWFNQTRRLLRRLPPDSSHRPSLAEESWGHLGHCAAKVAAVLLLVIAAWRGANWWCEAGAKSRRAKNLAHAADIIARARAAGSNEELRQAEADLEDKLPLINDITSEVSHKLKEARQALGARRNELALRTEEDVIRREFEGLMKAGKVIEAADMLVRQRADTPTLRDLRESFRSAAPNAIESRVASLRRDRKFDMADAHLQRALSSTSLLSLLDRADHGLLRELSASSKAAWGRGLYELAQKERTEKSINRYLTSPVDQRMDSYLNKYKDYLAKMSSKQTLRVSLEDIAWGDWWDKYTNRVRLDIRRPDDEVYTCLLYRDNVQSNKSGSSSALGGANFDGKPNEIVEVKVQVWNTEGRALISTRPAGVKVYNGTLANLDSLVLELEDDGDQPALGCKVTIRVTGLPERPELPPWRE